jgi:hypothetical protein
MTKEEFNKRVTELKNEREKINKLIYDATMEYISSLPYKEGDKIYTDYRSAVRITSITPHKDDGHNYTGDLDVWVNLAESDGTRSKRCSLLWRAEIDTIKKID